MKKEITKYTKHQFVEHHLSSDVAFWIGSLIIGILFLALGLAKGIFLIVIAGLILFVLGIFKFPVAFKKYLNYK